eukprot:TRINITY_DN81097_c0_g1_i1.p1 TRINITY_DN81097_c0_g1~~TRINITY_DN81097_c0_g1_i1.p1  ORF type:complete len:182 (-),score=59.40 TRINITY_DN81097_c0_g1_i1:109-654(-)
MAEDMDIDWEAMKKALPYARTPKEKARRKEMFQLFDPNGNGYLSLAEVSKGIRDILQCDDVFDCKPAIIRAFNAAKDVAPAKSGLSDDYITRLEFRLLLQYLRMYFELYQAFARIDEGDDGRIDIAEFVAAEEKLREWNIEIEDPEAEFATIDTNGGGQILFHEFCDWAIKKGLDLDDDDE